MTRLCVVVEGESEERFVRGILGPHLDAMAVWTTWTIVETSRPARGGKRRGGGKWKHWLRQIRNVCGDRSPDFRITTMFDFYGLPVDFPGLDEQQGGDTRTRAAALETAMARVVGDRRLVPNLLLHEFETLVLAANDQLMTLLDEDAQRSGLRVLSKELSGIDPEDVDDGKDTAPSKRLLSRISGYSKLAHGVTALQAAGLPSLRKACPRFDQWIKRLERLGSPEP